MGHIFGDTDDITFGGGQDRGSSSRPQIPRVVRPEPIHNPRPQKPQHTRGHTPVTQPPKEIQGGLKKLIDSMKPSFFPQGSDPSFRFTLLSTHTQIDPLILCRSTEHTLLIGTGFSKLSVAGGEYQAFPDMRLPYSERDRLIGWVLQYPGFAIASFQMILETLGFPHVYATRDVIAYIRAEISDPVFLDQCRFFEIFSVGTDERKIGDFLLGDHEDGLSISVSGNGIFSSHSGAPQGTVFPILQRVGAGFLFGDLSVATGEIIDIHHQKVTKHTLKFTFDIFYIDKNSVGVAAGYTLKDREILANNGVLTFVIEEDMRTRGIVGHIFIDSRGFVHAQEMMLVHKEVLKGIRHTYEQAILSHQDIERAELVQILRRELTKYCYLLTGRTPVVMPIIIER